MSQYPIEPGGKSSPEAPERCDGLQAFRIGACLVEPDIDRISGPAGETRVEPKTMAVLLYLAQHPGKVVGTDELIEVVWQGRPMGDNPVYRSIVHIRRALGDGPRLPTYIATVPKKGYRLIAPVKMIERSNAPEPDRDEASGSDHQQLVSISVNRLIIKPWSAMLLGLLVLTVWFWLGSGDEVVSLPADTERVTLAVIPFDNLSGEPDQEQFANGLSEAILNRLSAFRELRVTARSSSFPFKQSGYEVSRISELLGVRFLLLGSLRRDEDTLQVGVELVDSEGFQVWGDTFHYIIGGRYALDDEISSAVAGELVSYSTPLSDRRRPDFEAYQHFMLGHEMLVRRPPGFSRDAKKHFDRAIEIDQNYADAYAERAITSIFIGYGVREPEMHHVMAQHDIERALALDSDLALAHAAYGLLLQVREPPKYAESEIPLRYALKLNPNLINAWNWLANALHAQERFEEAYSAWSSAAIVDPLAPSIGANLATEDFRRGKVVAAERRLLRLLQLPQPAISAQRTLLMVYLETGRLVDSLDLAKSEMLLWGKLRDGYPDAPNLINLYATIGANERVHYWIERIDAGPPSPLIETLDRLIVSAPAVGGYSVAVAEFNAMLQRDVVDLDRLSLRSGFKYGILLALARDPSRAREVLEPLIDTKRANQASNSPDETNARHALAWAWQQTGKVTDATALLKLMEDRFLNLTANGRLHRSEEIFEYARNQALLGDTVDALVLLDRATQAGWRGYYTVALDPRWDAMSGDPRFRAIMADIKIKLDSLRAEIDRYERQDDFIARFDAVTSSRVSEQSAARPDGKMSGL